jgi:DUF1009 family protein
MPENKEMIGLIAGGGKFPLMIARSVRNQGFRVIAVAHRGETDASLAENVDKVVWIELGQLGKLISVLKKNGIQKALMAGTITKHRMFGPIKPDLKGLDLMSKMEVLHDDGILRAVADELAGEGIDILSSTHYVPELLAPPGTLTKRTPTQAEDEDIAFGWHVAKELGRLDIGQCVVVRNRTVLSLEAMEGTDETILRGGRLAREGAVVVKVSKPNQDLRFDMPSVGLETVEVMSRVKASVLAVEAGKTLLFDRSDMIAYADKVCISVISR